MPYRCHRWLGTIVVCGQSGGIVLRRIQMAWWGREQPSWYRSTSLMLRTIILLVDAKIAWDGFKDVSDPMSAGYVI